MSYHWHVTVFKPAEGAVRGSLFTSPFQRVFLNEVWSNTGPPELYQKGLIEPQARFWTLNKQYHDEGYPSKAPVRVEDWLDGKFPDYVYEGGVTIHIFHTPGDEKHISHCLGLIAESGNRRTPLCTDDCER